MSAVQRARAPRGKKGVRAARNSAHIHRYSSAE